jgi:hypothetical protein
VLLVVGGLGSVLWCCRLSVVLVLSFGGVVGGVGCWCCQLLVLLVVCGRVPLYGDGCWCCWLSVALVLSFR